MASSVIGALRVSLGLDSGQFATGLKQSSGNLDRFAKTAKVAFAAVAAAGVAAAAALGVAMKGAIDRADNLSKTAQRIGTTTEALSRLEWAGHIHIRPDWDDARRKFIAISPAGRAARDAALAAFMPRIADVVRDVGADRVRAALPVLRMLRKQLEETLRHETRGGR